MGKILASGDYEISSDYRIQSWASGGGSATGTLGQGPLRLIGLFDLKPEQGFPSAGFNYREWAIPSPTGDARIRFVGQNALNVSAITSDILYGTRTQQTLFTGYKPSNYASYALGTWVTAFDNPMYLDTFAPGASYEWDNLDATGQAWRSMAVGPELLSGFAQNNVQEFDLRQLGGGARFVGIWLASYWVGADPGVVTDWLKVKYTVEEGEGLPLSQPITFAFPVEKIQDQTGTVQELQAKYIVAQVNLQRFGGAPLTYTTQGSFRCQISNGGGVIVDAQIVPYVGTNVDAGITRADVACAAASATSTTVTSVEESEMQGPYSYANIYLQNDSAEGFEGGPAIVWVVVG